MSSLRDGPIRSRDKLQLLRFLFLTAALLAVLFMASGAALWHVDAPGSAATCPICHVMHMPTLSGAMAETVVSFATVAWLVLPERRLMHAPPSTLNAPPRAPPV